MKVEAIESLGLGMSWNALPKRDLTVNNLLIHTILRKFRSTSVYPLGGSPNWFMKNKKAAAPAKHLAVAVNLSKRTRQSLIELLSLEFYERHSNNIYYYCSNLFHLNFAHIKVKPRLRPEDFLLVSETHLVVLLSL
jgi:hypothetical protein